MGAAQAHQWSCRCWHNSIFCVLFATKTPQEGNSAVMRMWWQADSEAVIVFNCTYLHFTFHKQSQSYTKKLLSCQLVNFIKRVAGILIEHFRCAWM